jgi:FkbM family methyltransferase
MPATRPIAKLIYDIGLYNGDDTAYYLHHGNRVVAIEADPSWVNEAVRRFSRPLETGQLTILNVAIAEQDGYMDFWINEDNRGLNSFDRAMATREGAHAHLIRVETRTIGSIIAEFGVPDYLKVDIEGHDLVCINGLNPSALPPYISVETEAVGEGERLDDESALATLNALSKIGYCKFKLIAQIDFWPLSGSGVQMLYRKIVHSAAGGRLSRFGLGKIGGLLTPRTRLLKKVGYCFNPGSSSGPWGDDAFGAWMDVESARRAFLKSRRWHFRYISSSPFSFWCDWHAIF